MIAFVLDEHLCLMLEAPEGLAVDNAVAVALERRTERVLRLAMEPPTRFAGIDRIGRAPPLTTTEAIERQAGQSRLPAIDWDRGRS